LWIWFYVKNFILWQGLALVIFSLMTIVVLLLFLWNTKWRWFIASSIAFRLPGIRVTCAYKMVSYNAVTVLARIMLFDLLTKEGLRAFEARREWPPAMTSGERSSGTRATSQQMAVSRSAMRDEIDGPRLWLGTKKTFLYRIGHASSPGQQWGKPCVPHALSLREIWL